MDTANRILRSILSSLLLLVFISQSGNARNTISAIEPLKDGQVLTSMRDVFEVGFFSPGNSTRRYFGIWYKQLFHSKVVWVANRENPLNDSSGVVTIDRFGNLVLLDDLHNTIWSTNVSFTPMISTALLVCTGNLVLNEINSTGSDSLWQSFNHPSDSLLPSMMFNYENKTRNRDCLISWKSENDPSIGKFVLALDDSAIPQALILNGSVRHWRTAKFDQTGFVGVPTMYSNVLLGNQYLVSDKAEAQSAFMYAFFSPILVLDYSGILRQMVFHAVNRTWTEDWRAPSSKCDFYNTCGPFGICSEFESRTCSCLRGFEPKIAEEWKKGNWISGRCVRRTPLQCERNDSFVNKNQEDGFVKLKSVKLPDFSDLLRGADRKECQDRCLKNCSCVAYAFVYEVGCVVWSGDLIDIQELRIGGAELFLRLAFSDLDKKERKVKAYIIILITIAGAIILSGLAFILWRMKVKRRRERTRLVEMLASLDMLDNLGESPQAYLLQDKNRGSQELLLFDFKLITSATNQFSDKLGEGGFGPVYKGMFLDGPEIAVKRLSRSSGQGVREFKNELRLISKLQHRNLVRLLGCCIENEEKMLVYEYMPHKSLDAILFDPIKKSELDWKKRFNIIDGIARGLLYLHRDSRLKIIHRDLKASNILLDENMTPKISDFGMARIFGGDQTKANTNRVVGTYGYMSPEYAMEGIFSEKSDVFSFGVLVLEILSGRRNTSFYYLGSFVNLLGYAWQLWKEDKAMELIDPMLAVKDSKLDLMRCIHVGLLCVQECVADRPTMSAIVFMLGSDTILPSPKQPAFSPLQFSPTISLNNVTMTSMGGR